MHDLISSRDNPLFKRLKKLAESARARRETRTTLLDGEHLVEACLDAGGRPLTLLYSESCAAGGWQKLSARCEGVKVAALSDSLFAELSPVDSPAGVLAEVAWLNPAPRAAAPLVLLLENIQDPGNLGSLLRSAAAAGATLAVLSKGCHDAWSPKALRGGQGAQFVLPLETGVDLPAWLSRFAGDSLALALDGAESLYARTLTGPLAVLVGNEGAGLSPAVRGAARARVGIPMTGRVESLNAAAALAVAVFEAARQRAV